MRGGGGAARALLGASRAPWPRSLRGQQVGGSPPICGAPRLPTTHPVSWILDWGIAPPTPDGPFSLWGEKVGRDSL